MTPALAAERERLQNLVMHALACEDTRELYGLLAEIRGSAWEAMYQCRSAWRATEQPKEFSLEELGL